MKLAIFIPSLMGGGAERVIVRLANGLLARGYDVDIVLATKLEGSPYISEIEKDVRIVELNASRVRFSFFKLFLYLKKEKPDSLLSVMTHCNLLASMVCLFLPVRLVMSEHNILADDFLFPSTISSKFRKMFFKFLYRNADAVVAVSNGVAEMMSKASYLDPKKIFVVYNPVVTNYMLRQLEESFTFPEFIKENHSFILAVGRLTLQKDFPTLIKAFAKIHNKIDAKLIILGEGSLRGELQNLIQCLGLTEKVFMLGFASNPYVWMSRCSLFVLSSLHEGLPTVLIEALACGAPVVSTDCLSGPAEILEGGLWGGLVPVGDVDALADGMFQSLLSGVREGARERGLFFDEARAVEGYEKICFPKL